MQATRNGVTVSINDAALFDIALERLSSPPALAVVAAPQPFVIAQDHPEHGGVYAGLVRGEPGQRDYHLFVGKEAAGALNWDAAMAWAANHEGYDLPRRREQSVCFANVPELFQKCAYWSCEQHASNSLDAWFQYFDCGCQSAWLKTNGNRARLVRRLTI